MNSRGTSVQAGTRIRSIGQTTDWPTVVLLLAVYALFGFCTTLLAQVSLPLAIIATSIIIAQYSSLQHEVLHGHPFASQRLNEALVLPGLTLFVPYQRFRDLHLAHHHDEVLTDPYDDPESNYLDPAVWARLSWPRRKIHLFNNTLAGRILIGPAISIADFLRGDWRAVRAGDWVVARAWGLHLAGVGLVFLWLGFAGHMPVWAYLVSTYAGFGLLKIRTFLEHQAHERASGRTVIIEDRGPLALLFLNNNLHVVHHMHPAVPWYQLPALYRGNRLRYVTRNGGYVIQSYAEVFRRYLFTPKDPVPHPLMPPDAKLRQR